MKTEIGHYIVNGKLFDNKFDAVQFAQLTNSKVEWYFFDDVFQKTNWYIEPELSLTELYRLRAKQIREQYDYIVVFCSGGSDSTNVINTFLNNNIHVDEIIGIAPLNGLKNWSFNSNNTNEENTISEVKFALLPLLNKIASSHPNIKITINDYFDNLTDMISDEWMYEGCGNIVTTLTSQFTEVLKFNHIDKLIQSGKRVALIYGTDKPIIRIGESKSLYFIFADAGVNYLNLPTYRKFNNVDRVLFYWSPELPELLVKQAHVVAKAAALPQNKIIFDSLQVQRDNNHEMSLDDMNELKIQQNANPITKNEILKHYKPNTKMKSFLEKFSNKSLYQRLIVPYIYPETYDIKTFQCQKVNADAGFFTLDQAWVHLLHQNTKISDIISSGTQSLYNSISPKYLNKNGTGFINNIKVYKFGNINDI